MKLKFLPLIAVLLTSSGCFMSRVTAPGLIGTRHEDTGFSLFWGITRTDHGAVECVAGLQEVTTYWPWYSYLLQAVTLGIVSPIKREYTCLPVPAQQAPASAPAPVTAR